MIVTIRPAQVDDIHSIAERMRAFDRRECAAFGYAPDAALRLSLDRAYCAWTALIDGVPEAMFGLSVFSLLGGTGGPWMLSTDAAYLHAREFIAAGPDYLALMREVCPRLRNWVHQDNARAIRYLRWLGFEVGSEARLIGGEPMVLFSME